MLCNPCLDACDACLKSLSYKKLTLGVNEDDGQLAEPLPPLPPGAVDNPLAGGAVGGC